MTIKFSPKDDSFPEGKLADAELHFNGGPLDGMKLVGFAVWQRRNGSRNVSWPSRQYSAGPERRSYSLLRSMTGDSSATNRLRDTILAAFKDHEAALTQADTPTT